MDRQQSAYRTAITRLLDRIPGQIAPSHSPAALTRTVRQPDIGHHNAQGQIPKPPECTPHASLPPTWADQGIDPPRQPTTITRR
jgi:hypothetical protein